MAVLIASILFAVFAVNVVLGATAQANFLTDVQEMLILFASSIAFVATILRREAEARKSNEEDAQ